MRHAARVARRRAGVPTVIYPPVRRFVIYMCARASGPELGTLVYPFALWGDVVDRLRSLYASGAREALVRIVGVSTPLGGDARASIRHLEELGMRLCFEAFEEGRRGDRGPA